MVTLSLSLKKIMLTETEKSEKNSREIGFYLCKRNSEIVKGKTLIGEEDVLPDYIWESDEAQCPRGTIEIGNFHTHPGGKAYPSHLDVSAANFDNHSLTCIGARGEVNCWNLLSKKYSKNLKALKI